MQKQGESIGRVFRGCGHSYHTVCLISDITLGPKCVHVVSTELKALATKASEGLFQMGETIKVEDDSNDLEEEDLPEEEQNIHGAESRRIEALINQILSWQ